MRCDVVWCSVMQYGVMWCCVMWCGAVWCDVMWCGAVMAGTRSKCDARYRVLCNGQQQSHSHFELCFNNPKSECQGLSSACHVSLHVTHATTAFDIQSSRVKCYSFSNDDNFYWFTICGFRWIPSYIYNTRFSTLSGRHAYSCNLRIILL